MDKKIIIILHNIRSTHNVGSILRTCDGFGVEKVYFTGYTPYPHKIGDQRLPHIANKIHSQIHKTALGAENSVNWDYSENIEAVFSKLQTDSYQIVALEQSVTSTSLQNFKSADKVAVIFGEEVNGIPEVILEKCDISIEIPMLGKKESFNVSVAGAIALYQIRFL